MKVQNKESILPPQKFRRFCVRNLHGSAGRNNAQRVYRYQSLSLRRPRDNGWRQARSEQACHLSCSASHRKGNTARLIHARASHERTLFHQNGRGCFLESLASHRWWAHGRTPRVLSSCNCWLRFLYAFIFPLFFLDEGEGFCFSQKENVTQVLMSQKN